MKSIGRIWYGLTILVPVGLIIKDVITILISNSASNSTIGDTSQLPSIG